MKAASSDAFRYIADAQKALAEATRAEIRAIPKDWTRGVAVVRTSHAHAWRHLASLARSTTRGETPSGGVGVRASGALRGRIVLGDDWDHPDINEAIAGQFESSG